MVWLEFGVWSVDKIKAGKHINEQTCICSQWLAIKISFDIQIDFIDPHRGYCSHFNLVHNAIHRRQIIKVHDDEPDFHKHQ
jgi:hypothetical protein